MRTLGFGFASVVALTLVAGDAHARREDTYAYPYSRVWTAALRMLRIDFGSPITEKDRESGYFLFEYPESGKVHPGSVEVVRVIENGYETARVVIQVPALPSYFEQMLLDRLTRKLSQDYGQPVPVKAQPAPGPGSGAPPNAPSKDAKDDAAQPPPATGDKPKDAQQPPATAGAPK